MNRRAKAKSAARDLYDIYSMGLGLVMCGCAVFASAPVVLFVDWLDYRVSR